MQHRRSKRAEAVHSLTLIATPASHSLTLATIQVGGTPLRTPLPTERDSVLLSGAEQSTPYLETYSIRS
jgi:hypothetical protein